MTQTWLNDRRVKFGVAGLLWLTATQCALAAVPTLVTIYNFPGGVDGSAPTAGVVADKAGNLYGVTFDGGNVGCRGPKFGTVVGCGTVYELSHPAPGQSQWTKTILHSFTSNNAPDGAQPIGGLTIDKAGVLYGTAHRGGGQQDAGTVFSLVPPTPGGTSSWTFNLLYTFLGIDPYYDAAEPLSRLLLDKKGNIYGTTLFGVGTQTSGAVFKLTQPAAGQTNWTYQIIYNLPGNAYSGVVSDTAGNLYGAMIGNYNFMYELTPPPKPSKPWTFSYIFSFLNQNECGYTPSGELHIDANNVIYGTTLDGGAIATQPGAVYSLSPPAAGQTTWAVNTILALALNNHGAKPNGGVTEDHLGKLYGTTAGFTTNLNPDVGASVFELRPPVVGSTVWDDKKLISFDGTNGAFPMSNLIIALNGKLYGTAASGGANNLGTVFELTR